LALDRVEKDDGRFGFGHSGSLVAERLDRIEASRTP
jgi:hypothetical protein